MAAKDDQPTLFVLPPCVLEPVAVAPEQHALEAALSPDLRLGTMSWSLPGWRGVVYAPDTEPKLLAEAGLTAAASCR